MTKPMNRSERRAANVIAKNANSNPGAERARMSPNSMDHEMLHRRKRRLLTMQRAYENWDNKKGAAGLPNNFIVHVAAEPPLTVTMFGGRVVNLTTTSESIVEVGQAHLCEYTGERLEDGTREAVIRFSLRNRQRELDQVMAALRRGDR